MTAWRQEHLIGLGDVWYGGDYKAPMRPFEGGYGFLGALAFDGVEGRPICHYCGKAFDGLGRHAHAAHGLFAADYKRETGLLQKSALISERVRLQMVARETRRGRGRHRVDQHPMTMRSSSRPDVAGSRNGRLAPEALNRTGRCRAQVLETAKAIVREQGQLRKGDLIRRGIGEKIVARHFGSLQQLRLEAGAPALRWPRYGAPAMLVALRSLAMELGRTPSISDLSRLGAPTASAYAKRWGSYSQACREAGLDPNLPKPLRGEDEIAILSAYAVTGGVKRTATATGLGELKVMATLHRYGFPFPGGYNGPGRREWAADMARRLAGWPEEPAA